MQAIQSKILKATANKSMRVKAWSHTGKLVKPYDEKISEQENIELCCKELAASMEWKIKSWLFGTLKNSDTVALYVVVETKTEEKK